MSKIKTNPRMIKDCIIAVKNCNLGEDKKESVVKILKQYQQDKQQGIYTDGQVLEKLRSCIYEMENEYTNFEYVYNVLCDVVMNMDLRKYY